MLSLATSASSCSTAAPGARTATRSCRAFERSGQALSDAGVKIAALSVDDKETTAALVAGHQLTFPVGYGANAAAVAAVTGAFVNPDPAFLQSTGFVLDPAGNVVVSVYSTGAIGRLVPDDVIGLVRYLREHSPAEAGPLMAHRPPHNKDVACSAITTGFRPGLRVWERSCLFDLEERCGS